MPKNYTVQEVKEFFRKDSVVTIRRWIAEGRFPNATKVVDGWLIPEEDVLALYESGKYKMPLRKRGIISRGVE